MTPRRRRSRTLAAVFLVVGATACSAGRVRDTTVENWRVEVVTTLPHDPALFTQGLELDATVLYESSGLYGRSVVRAVDRASGAVLGSFTFPERFFAEGLTRVGGRLIVLSWQERTAFVLDAATLTERARLAYDGEGWGSACSAMTSSRAMAATR